MRKMMTFTFGVLVGTVVATAWANFPNYPTMDSPRYAGASMNPLGDDDERASASR